MNKIARKLTKIDFVAYISLFYTLIKYFESFLYQMKKSTSTLIILAVLSISSCNKSGDKVSPSLNTDVFEWT